MNSVKLEGNVGKNGVSSFTTATLVMGVRFSVAVNNSSVHDEPTWVTCFAWDTVASNIAASGAKKGSRIYVEGELRHNKDGLYLYIKTGNLKKR